MSTLDSLIRGALCSSEHRAEPCATRPSHARASTFGLIVLALVVSTPLLAQQLDAASRPSAAATKQETVGFGSGLALGAAAGGPIGAIVGAATGAILGGHYHRLAQKHVTLANDLSRSEADRRLLAGRVAEIDATLIQTQQRATRLDATLSRTNEIQTDVGFRTNDASINAKAMPPLLKLGALAATMPEVRVRIVGHADPRGSDEFNTELSQRRAAAVAAVLSQAGLSPEQLMVEGHGKSESSSTYGDIDGYAFDRRVTVRIERLTASPWPAAEASGWGAAAAREDRGSPHCRGHKTGRE